MRVGRGSRRAPYSKAKTVLECNTVPWAAGWDAA